MRALLFALLLLVPVVAWGGDYDWGDATETACVANGTGASAFTDCPLTCHDYVGGAAGAGEARCQPSSNDFDAILGTLITAGYRRILFNGGDTWTWNNTYGLATNGPGLIGRYGTGRAVINITAAVGANALSISGDDWRFQDIEFGGGPADGGQAFFGSDTVKNLLIQRTYSDSTGWNGEFVEFPVDSLSDLPDNRAHRNIFLIDNYLDREGSALRYTVFGVFWGINILGNTWIGENDGTLGGANFRLTGVVGGLISNNYMQSGSGGTNRPIMHIRDHPAGCPFCPAPLCGTHDQYVLIQDNYLECNAPECIKMTQSTCADNAPQMGSEDFIVERNFLRALPGSTPSGNAIYAGSSLGDNERFHIRNNVHDQTDYNYATGLHGQDGVYFYNNTCYRSDSAASSNSFCIEVSGATPSECINNVMYAPNESNRTQVGWKRPSSGSCSVESGNKDDGAVDGTLTSNPFDDWGAGTVAGVTPKSGSQLIDAGTDIPTLFDDALGNDRPSTSGDIDVGAVERQ